MDPASPPPPEPRTDVPTLPADFRCIGCGYPIGTGSNTCPECGRHAGEDDLNAHRARAELLAQHRRRRPARREILLALAAIAGAIPPLLNGIAAGMGWIAAAILPVLVSILLLIIFVLPLVGGWIAGMRPDDNRDIEAALWAREVGLLHTPWLAILPAVTFATLGGSLLWSFSVTAGRILVVAGAILVFPAFLALLLGLDAWIRQIRVGRARTGLPAAGAARVLAAGVGIYIAMSLGWILGVLSLL